MQTDQPRLAPLAALATAALLLAPHPLAAQQLELTGQAGALVPAADLIEGSGTTGSGASLETGLPVAGTAGLRLPSGLAVEVSGLQAYDVDVDGTSLQTAEADFSALTGHLTYNLSVPGLRKLTTPFFGLGAGVREIDFGAFASDAAAIDASSDFTGVGLAGLQFGTGSTVGVRLESRLYLSSFDGFGESNAQQDFAFLGGLTLRLP